MSVALGVAVIESKIVATPEEARLKRPIGVLAALAAGFDRVAARPALLLPPLVLDLFLWLGPQLRASALIREVTSALTVPPGVDQTLKDQLVSFQSALADIAGRFNLFGSLSALPGGVPSLMASRMPGSSPLAWQPIFQAETLPAIAGFWALFTIVGLGLGAFFQSVIARQIAPPAEVAGGLRIWGRFIGLAAVGYGGMLAVLIATTFVVSLASVVLPLLGAAALFVAFSFVFWVAVYLWFTPHGIVRYRLGVLRAMIESVQLVRWNLPSTVGFLSLSVIITWLTGMVWALPADNSWFSGLALLGHAFVSVTLVTGSYAFYQGRHEWMVALRRALMAKPPAGADGSTLSQPPPGEG